MEGEHPRSTPLYRRQTVRTSVESGDFEVFIRQPLDFTGWGDDLDGEKAEIPGKLKGEIFELSVRHPSGLTDGGGADYESERRERRRQRRQNHCGQNHGAGRGNRMAMANDITGREGTKRPQFNHRAAKLHREETADRFVGHTADR